MNDNEEIVEFAARLLSVGYYAAELQMPIMARYHISANHAYDCIREARHRLYERAE